MVLAEASGVTPAQAAFTVERARREYRNDTEGCMDGNHEFVVHMIEQIDNYGAVTSVDVTCQALEKGE